MWIADDGDNEIYTYEFETWEHLPDRDINTFQNAGNTGLADIWSDGQTLWAAETGSWTAWGGWTDGKVFAYDLETGARLPSKDFDNQIIQESGLKSPTGIWSDGTDLWIADRPGHRVFVFNINKALAFSPVNTPSRRDNSQDFIRLGRVGNSLPTHLWSDNTTLWVADNLDATIYAYDLASHERKPEQDLPIVPEVENRLLNPAGIWSDGTVFWVADWYSTRVAAFGLRDHGRLPSRDINTLFDSGNHHPKGMWSDKDTLWVLDNEDARIYAYALTGGERRPESDITELRAHGNSSPRGLWSDGNTFWVADWENEKIFAYRVEDGAREPDKDIDDLFASGNLSPSGLWSNGESLWVADYADAQIYSYSLDPNAPQRPKPQARPELALRRDPSSPLRWNIEYSGILKSAPTVNGPFEPVIGAHSPFTINTDQAAQIFIVEPQ